MRCDEPLSFAPFLGINSTGPSAVCRPPFPNLWSEAPRQRGQQPKMGAPICFWKPSVEGRAGADACHHDRDDTKHSRAHSMRGMDRGISQGGQAAWCGVVRRGWARQRSKRFCPTTPGLHQITLSGRCANRCGPSSPSCLAPMAPVRPFWAPACATTPSTPNGTLPPLTTHFSTSFCGHLCLCACHALLSSFLEDDAARLSKAQQAHESIGRIEHIDIDVPSAFARGVCRS